MNQQFRRFQFGEFNCAIISDGNYSGTAEMLFPHAPTEELAQALDKYQEEANNLPAGQNCLFVDTGQNKVLLDTGLGPGITPQTGKLIENLAAGGVRTDDIDTVFITHCHGDHIGGLTDETGNLAFPNARHYMWQKEWEHWTDEHELARKSEWSADFARRKLSPLSSNIELVSQEGEFVSGIAVVPAPGHTVGHSAVTLQSTGDQFLYLADAILHPIHVEHPDWVATVDHDPAQTVSTRKRLLAWASQNQALTLVYHFLPFPGLGRVISTSPGHEWQPDQEFN